MMRNPELIKAVKSWLPLATAVTFIFITVYAVAQQTWRAMADFPQVQIAQDIARSLELGEDPVMLNQAPQVDMAKSLAPFVIIYNANGEVFGAAAKLNGQTPVIEKGALDLAKEKGQNRLTWEPEKGVREAAIIMPYTAKEVSGFVLVGRSLQETETWLLGWLQPVLLAGWLVTLLFTFIVVTILMPKRAE